MRHFLVSLPPLLAAMSLLLAGCRDSGPDRNVILIVVDTLRADHLGCYGYGRETSPVLDALAKDAVLFENARSQASWTAASMASLLTSLYPFRHGVLHPSTRHRLPSTARTLPERLANSGYACAGFVANKILRAEGGMAQGFDPYDVIPLRADDRDDAALVNEAAIPWIRENADGPFFVYLHYMDPHDPYDDPQEWYRAFDPGPAGELRGRIEPIFAAMKRGEAARIDDRELRHLVARYDGEIRYVDGKIGEVLVEIERLGLTDRTTVIVTSDHGEQFLDHGSLKHATSIHDEEIRVPLLVRSPEVQRPGRRIPDPVELVDLLPTILDLATGETAGEASAGEMDGRSVLPLLLGESLPEKDQFAETSHGWEWKKGRVTKSRSLHLAIVREGRKLILHDGRGELFDLHGDPGERNDIAGIDASETDVLSRELLAWKRACENAALDPELIPAEDFEAMKEALRKLGYLDDGENGK